MSANCDLNDLKRRMQSAVDVLHKDFSGLRTGRASISLLDPIVVEAYGASMPLNQVATVGAPEPRLLSVQVWDKGLVKSVEKAIRESNLGLNPQCDGSLIRIPIPPLSEERRLELVKIAGKYTEQSKVAIRNVRRDGMDALKHMEKDKQISEDELAQKENEIQKITDDFIKNVDDSFASKEKEIKQI